MGEQIDRNTGDVVCDNRTGYMGVLIAFFAIFLSIFGFGLATLVKQEGWDSGAIILSALDLLLAGSLACLCLACVNTRLSLVGDRITWINYLGKVRLDCTIHDVVRGSFKAKTYSTRGGPSTNYRVETSKGLIKFHDRMRNSDRLAERLKAISDDVAPSAHAPAAWTGDPLSESDPGQIPIK